jgi:hypothetical protein
LLVDFEFDTALAQFASLQIHLEHTQAAMPGGKATHANGTGGVEVEGLAGVKGLLIPHCE